MNRKQRRAQGGTSLSIKSADDIPMAKPDTNTERKAKTLYELAAERQAALMPTTKKFDEQPTADNVVNVKIGPNGEIVPMGKALNNEFDNTVPEEVNPILDTLLLASSLSALHFTLETLTVHQYAEELRFKPIFWQTLLVAFPTLTLLVHFMHGHIVSIPLSVKAKEIVYAGQALFFVALANICGCYLIQLTNEEGYMAVMKNAPRVGTLWVWSVLELGLVGALAGVVGPGVYAWYNGYGIV